nr:Chain C, Helicon FP06655 [synthetic construct]7UYK_D Chain D, Helicon FP06655 [synthetic construct]
DPAMQRCFSAAVYCAIS